ncbi:hypothetical protein [Streptomyces massasporeus]
MTAILSIIFLLVPVAIFVFAVRGFVTDVRRRAYNRHQANERFRQRDR